MSDNKNTVDTSKKDTKRILCRTAIPAIIFVFGALTVAWFTLLNLPLDERGTFGDMFGGVNALFSGLAFAGVIIAIVLQSKELELQRQELAETRAEIRGQRKQLEAQADTMRKQNFEQTFFQMVRLRNELNSYLLTRFRGCWESFRHQIDNYVENAPNEYTKSGVTYDEEIEHSRVLSEWFDGHGNDVTPYFNVLKTIILYLDSAEIDDKQLYVNILRSQMIQYELVLLFYFGLATPSIVDLKPALESLSFFQTLDIDILKAHEFIYYYREPVFGDRYPNRG